MRVPEKVYSSTKVHEYMSTWPQVCIDYVLIYSDFVLQWPNAPAGSQSHQAYQDTKTKMDKSIELMGQSFRRMKLIYNKVYETTAGLDNRPIEVN